MFIYILKFFFLSSSFFGCLLFIYVILLWDCTIARVHYNITHLEVLHLLGVSCRNIRFIEGNAKLTCKGTVAAGVYLSEAQNPIPPPPYTLYTCIQYTYSHREGGGEES